MDTLYQIINGMNKEDIRFYKLFSLRTDAGSDRKDHAFFDYIRKKKEDYDEDKIASKLYGDKRNAFYQMKNRLIEEINKSLMIQHVEDDDNIHIMHLLAVSKYYFNKNLYNISFHFIRKAEKKALQLENFDLLDVIYGEFIKLSHEIVSINPEMYIRKRKENMVQLSQIREIDDILSAVSYRIKISQNLTSGDENVLSLLEKTVNDYSKNEQLKNSSRLRFRIYAAVSQILLRKFDYKGLESYLLDTYKKFVKEKLFNKSNHDTKLQMLTYIVNSLFKNDKLNKSLEYAEILHEAMLEYNKLYYDKYLFFYYNSLVINYSQLDVDKAISILETLKENAQLKKTSYYEFFIYLNLAVLNFDKGDFRSAIKNLNRFYLHEGYKNADEIMKFKISIAELIIRYELGDYDFLERKIAQMKKDNKALLSEEKHLRENELIGILEELIVTENVKQNKKLYQKIKAFINEGSDVIADDTEILKYNDWLKTIV